MGKRKYDFKTRAEFQSELNKCRSSRRAAQWLLTAQRIGQVVGFSVDCDGKSCLWIAAYSPRGYSTAFASISSSVFLDASLDYQLEELAADSNNRCNTYYREVLDRAKELLSELRLERQTGR